MPSQTGNEVAQPAGYDVEAGTIPQDRADKQLDDFFAQVTGIKARVSAVLSRVCSLYSLRSMCALRLVVSPDASMSRRRSLLVLSSAGDSVNLGTRF